ncbi:MAG: DNA methyltransferase [Candidatus Limiplasma sp.]|nr:DNA methyltransferase [Candidatus Limiplasma sp.]
MMTYQEFLESKIQTAPLTGFEVDPSEVNPALKPHQRDGVVWAARGGCRALFEHFGLGKTIQQLEWCRLVLEREDAAKPGEAHMALIVLPLGVRREFIRDAELVLGWDEPPFYVRTMAEVRERACLYAAGGYGNILMTNYERVRDGDIEPSFFTAVSLDEASVLRSFGSKTYQTFLPKFRDVSYKLVSTATPSPNRYKELIHYAGYLGVMDTGQALTRFFQRDSKKANNLTLYPHKEQEFWLWLSTWAFLITKPSDLGYDDAGYALPPLEIRTHKVAVRRDGFDADRDGQLKLMRDAALGLQAAAAEKKDSLGARIAKMAEIVQESPEDHFILWHDLEDERRAIKRALPEAVEVYGTQDLEEREQRVMDFADGHIRLLATKKSISGSGCNFQRHCHRAIFVGVDYEFNDFIQAIHRIYRFMQTEPVVIDIIYTEAETEILAKLMEKWEQHNYLADQMTDIIRKYGIGGGKAFEQLRRSIGVKRVEVKGKRYRAVMNDCIEATMAMQADSVGLIHTSIPFSNHYEYTPSYNDFGHNEDTARFFEQMDFLTPNLLRILQPGRVFACHVKDRVLYGNATGTGMPTIEPFHSLCIDHYMRHGFQYFGMITVVTDVVRENNQTYRLGWSECCKDGTKMGVGCPEYILLFRKLPSDTSKAYADEPVSRSKEEYTRAQWQIDAHGFWRSSGDRLVSKEELAKIPVDRLQSAFRKYSQVAVYSYAEHVALAKKLDADGKLPATFMVVAPGSWTDEVWDDINRMRTLNTTQSQRRQAMHVCPLQLDIVERIIGRYSNPGDVVFDPFAGLMTVPMMAVKMGRYGIGTELNPDYFRDGVGYLQGVEQEMEQPTLFDFLLEVQAHA